jgi:L-cysteine desulfidase
MNPAFADSASEGEMSFCVKDILRAQVAPALGCTEPVAVALAAAAAAGALPGRPERVALWVDPNIYKNGLAVIIPGTGGLSGLDLAGALGAFGGNPALGLEVLEPLTPESVQAARTLVRDGGVSLNLLQDQRGLFIRAEVFDGSHVAEAVVRDLHDNVVSVTLDGEPVPVDQASPRAVPKADASRLEAWIKALSLEDLVRLLDDLDDEDREFLMEGVRTNMRLAEHGLKFGPGLGIGKALDRLVRQKLVCRDMILAARILTSAASDARMGGVKLPAMSSAGSGNHGLTAILPIWAIREFIECDEKTVLEAMALSHLVTAYVKSHTGRLSAICGCSVAAGAGASAGVAYLLGGNLAHIAGAIKNIIEDLAGVICDGAKAGCSLKLATAAGTAVQSALFSLQGVNVLDTDGIIGASPEQTMQNIGMLSTEGMIETDRTILKIMLAKRFSGF